MLEDWRTCVRADDCALYCGPVYEASVYSAERMLLCRLTLSLRIFTGF